MIRSFGFLFSPSGAGRPLRGFVSKGFLSEPWRYYYDFFNSLLDSQIGISFVALTLVFPPPRTV